MSCWVCRERVRAFSESVHVFTLVQGPFEKKSFHKGISEAPTEGWEYGNIVYGDYTGGTI